MKAAVGLLALLTVAASPPKRIAAQTFTEMRPGSYVSLGTTVTVRKIPRKSLPLYRVSVQFPGHNARAIVIDGHGWESTAPVFAVGRMSVNGPPVVWIESNSGGAHCCREPQLVKPIKSGTAIVDLLRWDGETASLWPDDVDGDGERDLIFADNRFLYTFTSYASSYAPPRIFNIVKGQMVDVSTKPGFRKIYVDWMKNAWEDCLEGGRGGCAAYVASAARIGREKQAWGDMLRSYDRKADWELPPVGCKKASVTAFDCPEGFDIPAKDYPESLRAFLVRTGYLKH